MKVIIYSLREFEKTILSEAIGNKHAVTLAEEPLSLQTVQRAEKSDAVVVFTGDDVSTNVVKALHKIGVRYIATRAAGYDNIDIRTVNELGMKCANVPAYSPHAIAEHAVALILCLNRKLILANKQVHQHNFTVDNLVGFDLNGKTAGIVGTGRIGRVVAKILHGFGCHLLAFDLEPDESLVVQYNLRYVELDELCASSDIITLNTPLNKNTKYLVNKDQLNKMKEGVLLINTARGGVIDTQAVIEALTEGKIGALGIDVYEKEQGVFFHDFSTKKVDDEMLKNLLRFPNVMVTPHQAFATKEALSNIADTTVYNLDCWAQLKRSENELPHRKTDAGTGVPSPSTLRTAGRH